MKKPSKWTANAKLLLEAFAIYEDSLCGSCGQSGFHALDPLNTPFFDVDTVVCLGCEARDTYQENQGQDRVHGEKVYVVNDMG